MLLSHQQLIRVLVSVRYALIPAIIAMLILPNFVDVTSMQTFIWTLFISFILIIRFAPDSWVKSYGSRGIISMILKSKHNKTK